MPKTYMLPIGNESKKAVIPPLCLVLGAAGLHFCGTGLEHGVL